MAIDFPASPTNGQTFTSGSVTYTWDGTKWTAVAAAGSSNSISQGNTNATVTDTGSDGRFVVTTEGSERLRVDSSGRLGIGSNVPPANLTVANNGAEGFEFVPALSSNLNRLQNYNRSGSAYCAYRVDASQHEFHISGSEKARLDTSGRLLVGTSTSNSNTNSKFQIADTSSNVTTTSYSANNSSAGYYYFFKNRGASVDSHTVLQSGDGIANLWFGGSDGTTYRGAASIEAVADGGWSSGDAPGRLVFSTTADGASSPTERMRISANGETTFSATVNTILGLKIGEASGWSGNPAIHTSSNVGYIIIRNGTSGGVGLSGGGTSWSSLSDENYKTDLTPITDAATKVRSLRTVTGRYIDDDEDTSRSFLIAQDVEAVLPQAVSTADSGQKLLSYTDTIPLLTAALKEALEKIETLEAKVAALESA